MEKRETDVDADPAPSTIAGAGCGSTVLGMTVGMALGLITPVAILGFKEASEECGTEAADVGTFTWLLAGIIIAGIAAFILFNAIKPSNKTIKIYQYAGTGFALLIGTVPVYLLYRLFGPSTWFLGSAIFVVLVATLIHKQSTLTKKDTYKAYTVLSATFFGSGCLSFFSGAFIGLYFSGFCLG